MDGSKKLPGSNLLSLLTDNDGAIVKSDTLPATDPFNDPAIRRRLGAIQTLAWAIMVGLTGIAVGVGMVVGYALDWQPVAGNAVTFSGISGATIFASILTGLCIPAALMLGRWKTESELQAIARVHPELAGSGEEADRLMQGFAAITFAYLLIPMVIAFANSLLFHVNSDPLMLGLVGILIIFIASRYPTQQRAIRWFKRAYDFRYQQMNKVI